ncbi:MAG: hypothetical protein CK424_03005 [Legionella sp.]|nr:MAG: hypothetical protein CK424_03005 [Legionella sp.]
MVDQFFCEPLFVGTIFNSEILDDLCQEIGKLNATRVAQAVNLKKEETASSVYITSKVHISGGHTAALMDLIRLTPNERSFVIVTNTCGPTDKNTVCKKISNLTNTKIEFIPRGNHLAKLTWLQTRLMELSPTIVWLFNNHQDSVAVAAVQPRSGYQLKYYHHGDDRLCLGATLSYAEHFDPIPISFHNCRHNLSIANNRYLPLTTRDLGVQIKHSMSDPLSLVTCTAGGFNKIEIDYFVRYEDTVGPILEITRGRHIHFGRLTPFALKRIKRGLLVRKIPKDCFVYIPYVQSIWKALYQYNIDLYITSFPYGGGRTLVEVMGAGIPIIIHSHACNQMIGGADMAYSGAMVWKKPVELYAFLKNIDSKTLDEHRHLSRAWYEKFHKEEIVKHILSDVSYDADVPEIRKYFYSDPLMRAWFIAQSTNLKGIFKRSLLRTYRQLMSFIGRMLS